MSLTLSPELIHEMNMLFNTKESEQDKMNGMLSYYNEMVEGLEKEGTLQVKGTYGGWFDSDSQTVERVLSIPPMTAFNNYRIKPQLKKVKLEASDIPPVCWVRILNEEIPRLVSEIHHDRVCINHRVAYTYKWLLSDGEMSTDLKTWKPCWKEIDE